MNTVRRLWNYRGMRLLLPPVVCTDCLEIQRVRWAIQEKSPQNCSGLVFLWQMARWSSIIRQLWNVVENVCSSARRPEGKVAGCLPWKMENNGISWRKNTRSLEIWCHEILPPERYGRSAMNQRYFLTWRKYRRRLFQISYLVWQTIVWPICIKIYERNRCLFYREFTILWEVFWWMSSTERRFRIFTLPENAVPNIMVPTVLVEILC